MTTEIRVIYQSKSNRDCYAWDLALMLPCGESPEDDVTDTIADYEPYAVIAFERHSYNLPVMELEPEVIAVHGLFPLGVRDLWIRTPRAPKSPETQRFENETYDVF